MNVSPKDGVIDCPCCGTQLVIHESVKEQRSLELDDKTLTDEQIRLFHSEVWDDEDLSPLPPQP